MKFVDKLLSMIGDTARFIGDMIFKLIEFLAKPLSYLWYFLDGIFYFFYQLFLVVAQIIMIFVAILQFFGALVLGFFRTLKSFLVIDFNATPINMPSTSYLGVQEVLKVIDPMGLLSVVPMIATALIWFFFIKKILGLLGGDVVNRA